MLDVIVTISNSTPRNFVNECRRSVKLAAELCPYPVNVIETPGVPGHIGKAMASGVAKSTAEYITWVDDDDFVLPTAFACLEKHYKSRPQAICARELHLSGIMIRPYNERHHLTAFRRDAVNPAWFERPAGIRRTMLCAQMNPVVDVLSWVYVYRIWNSAGFKLRNPPRP